MRADDVGKKTVILDRDVARERPADRAIVCRATPSHEKVARADARCQSFAVRSMKRAELANDVVVSDFEVAGLAFELHVLRFAADYGVFEDAVSRPEASESFDYRVGSNLAIRADFDVILDDGCGVNRHF